MPLPIEQYALIGDCQTAALVGSDGSIDWLCFPNFDSGACFAALLGSPQNGRWLLSPAEPPLSVKRRYRGDSLILETDYETSTGAVTVIDCMPPRSAEPDLVRMVVGRRGTVRMQMELIARFDYGSIVPWVRKVDHSLLAVAGPDCLVLQSPVPLHGRDLTTVADFMVGAGQEVPLVLMWYPSHQPAPGPVNAREAVDFTDSWWQTWSKSCAYQGRWCEAVRRSLITLKALTFAPTGGIVAAPTTSLPEQLGSVRNWDYRFCWLRDATFTLYCLLVAGYTDEATAWRDWLLRAVAGDPNRLQIMYGIFGQRRLTEFELPWLAGYEQSQPVRVGNAASEQFQLDVYGEVLDMLHVCRKQGISESETDWRFQRALLHFLESAWRQPDEGIWEVRGPRRHFTHSKVMAWVAFDRAVKAVEQSDRSGPAAAWRQIRDEIHAEICAQGFNQQLGAFVQYYGSDEFDASLLMIPLVGFLPANDSRMQGTLAAIEKNLMREGLVDRYATRQHVDGLPPGEGSFLPCSFWYADNLALAGRYDEAVEMFERLLSLRTDLGLLAEEYDPVGKRLLGNFPQAFSHVGLVNTARNLTTTSGPAQDRQRS
jgi:GH15 family glucan-1,4-alpha-glucosidase